MEKKNLVLRVIEDLLGLFLLVVVGLNLSDYIGSAKNMKGGSLGLTIGGHVVLILMLLVEVLLPYLQKQVSVKVSYTICAVCLVITVILMMMPIAFGKGNLGLNLILLVLDIADVKLTSPVEKKA